MNTYFRLLSFASPISRFALPFLIFSVGSTIFGMLNFALLIPLLDVLFGNQTSEILPSEPEFALEVNYFKDLFYYYFGQLMEAEGKFAALQYVCIIIISSIVLANLSGYIATRSAEHLRTHAIRNIRVNLFERIIQLHVGYFTNQRKGDIMSRFTTDAQQIETSIYDSLRSLFKEPFNLIAYFYFLFALSTNLTLFTLIYIPLSGTLIALIVKRLKSDSISTQHTLGVITGMLDEALTGLRVIKAFNASDHIIKKYEEENDTYARHLRSLAYKREFAPHFSEVMGVGVVVGILLYGGNMVLNNESDLTASQFVTYIFIFSQVMRPAKTIVNTVSSMQRAMVSGERVLELIDAKPAISDKPSAHTISGFNESVALSNVTFAYEDKKVIDSLSLTINKGETVALVGPSGGGKSTIADLIPRFYEVNDGEVTIDGQNVKDITLESLRQQMGIVTQESILFHDSIFNNIAFGNKEAKMEDVIAAAKIANAHEFISQTENGYDTVIGDRGMKLSGGQRQRLSIARAVFKNPPILILDEATSALDTESEKLVQEALDNLMRNRTSLVIAHRLSTIQSADKIIVLEQGKIVEQGTHDELLENENSRYKALRQMQDSK